MGKKAAGVTDDSKVFVTCENCNTGDDAPQGCSATCNDSDLDNGSCKTACKFSDANDAACQDCPEHDLGPDKKKDHRLRTPDHPCRSACAECKDGFFCVWTAARKHNLGPQITHVDLPVQNAKTAFSACGLQHESTITEPITSLMSPPMTKNAQTHLWTDQNESTWLTMSQG